MKKGEGVFAHNRSAQDRAYDLLGQLLIERQTQRLLKEIEDEKALGNTIEMEQFFAKQEQLHLSRIRAYCRKERMKRLFQITLPKAGKIAAVFIALLALAGGVAIASSHAVRVRVMQLLIRVEEQYTELKLVEDDEASFEVPVGWKGDSFLSYVPEGLVLSNVGGIEGASFVEYKDPQTQSIRLRFQEFDASVESNIDTEGAEIIEVSVRGFDGFMSLKGATTMVVWSDGLDYFVLTTKGMAQEETLAIAEAVRKTE